MQRDCNLENKRRNCDGMDFKMGIAATLPELSEWTLATMIWEERGKTNLFFLKNQGFLSKIPKMFCPGLSEKLKILSKQILLRLELLLNLNLSDYNIELVKTFVNYYIKLHCYGVGKGGTKLYFLCGVFFW